MAYYPAPTPPNNLSTAFALYDQLFGPTSKLKAQQLEQGKQNLAIGQQQLEQSKGLFPGIQELQKNEIARGHQTEQLGKFGVDAATRTAQTAAGLRDAFRVPDLKLPPVFGLDKVGDITNNVAGAGLAAEHATPFNLLPIETKVQHIQQFQRASNGSGNVGDLASEWDKAALPLAGSLPIQPPKIVGGGPKLYPSAVASTPGQPPSAQFSPVDPVFARQLELQNKQEDYAKGLRETMAKNAPITSYVGSGDHPGVRQTKNQLDALVSQYRDQKTGQVDWTRVSPSEAFTLLFSEGQISNPGAIVRQSELDSIAHQIGIKDKAENIVRNVLEGKKYPPALLQNIYNTVSKKAEGARQDFFKNFSGIEEEAGRNPFFNVGTDRLIFDPTLRQEYEDWKAGRTQASSSPAGLNEPLKFTSPAEAAAAASSGKLPPGAPLYVPGPNGWIKWNPTPVTDTNQPATGQLPQVTMPLPVLNILGAALGHAPR